MRFARHALRTAPPAQSLSGQQTQEGQGIVQVEIARCGAAKIVQVESPPQQGGGRRLAVVGPQPLQPPFRVLRRHEPRFAAGVEAEEQPFEVRGEVHQPQVAPTRHRFGIAAGGAVPCQPVGVEKDESAAVAHSDFVMSPSPVDGVLDHPAGVSAAGNDDIEMKMEILFVA